MLVVQATPQTVESARTIIVLFAMVFVIFWRVLIKIALMVAAIVAIVLLTSGAILIYQIIFPIAR